MGKVNVQKRGKVYQYQFEIARANEKRKFQNKGGFETKAEAEREGIKAYTEYMQTGVTFKPSEIPYSDYLDYWMKEYCQINLKCHTIESYERITRIHIKPKLGHYLLTKMTRTTLQKFINGLFINNSYSKNYLKTILKVIRNSFNYASSDGFDFIKINPSINVKVQRYDVPDEELGRFKDTTLFNNRNENEEEMENKICQSCGMPITSNEQLGKNKDGSINNNYCKYCYENGEFIDKVTMKEYIEMCSQYGSQAGMTNEEMKEHCMKLFPALKRWKCTCTDECASGYNPNCTCENTECHYREK